MKIKKILSVVATVFTFCTLGMPYVNAVLPKGVSRALASEQRYFEGRSESDRAALTSFKVYARELFGRIDHASYGQGGRASKVMDVIEALYASTKPPADFISTVAKNWDEGKPGDCRASSLLLSNKLDEIGIEHYSLIFGPVDNNHDLHKVVLYRWCER